MRGWNVIKFVKNYQEMFDEIMLVNFKDAPLNMTDLVGQLQKTVKTVWQFHKELYINHI